MSILNLCTPLKQSDFSTQGPLSNFLLNNQQSYTILKQALFELADGGTGSDTLPSKDVVSGSLPSSCPSYTSASSPDVIQQLPDRLRALAGKKIVM